MVRDLDKGETGNGKTIKLYWVTLETKQEDCDRRNMRKARVKFLEYWKAGLN